MSDSEYTSSSESDYEEAEPAPEPKLPATVAKPRPEPKIGSKKYLIDQARVRGIKGYSKMSKAQLEMVLNVKIPGVTDTSKTDASPMVASNEATTSPTVKHEEATVASNGSPKVAINEATIAPKDSPKRATNDATSSRPETVKQEEATVASKDHFDPIEESKKLDLKLNSMAMADLKLAAKRANIKVSKYNPEMRKSTPKTRRELLFDVKKFCLESKPSDMLRL